MVKKLCRQRKEIDTIIQERDWRMPAPPQGAPAADTFCFAGGLVSGWGRDGWSGCPVMKVRTPVPAGPNWGPTGPPHSCARCGTRRLPPLKIQNAFTFPRARPNWLRSQWVFPAQARVYSLFIHSYMHVLALVTTRSPLRERVVNKSRRVLGWH